MADTGFRGTSSEQDGRFSDKEKKLLKQMKFEEILEKKVDLTRVKMDVIKPWITMSVNRILGIEDDVVIEYINSQLEEKNLNPKLMQINITGFLNARQAREFMSELWALLVEGSEAEDGIPKSLVEKKLESMKLQNAGNGEEKKPVPVAMAESDWTNRYASLSSGKYMGPTREKEVPDDRIRERSPPRRRPRSRSPPAGPDREFRDRGDRGDRDRERSRDRERDDRSRERRRAERIDEAERSDRRRDAESRRREEDRMRRHAEERDREKRRERRREDSTRDRDRDRDLDRGKDREPERGRNREREKDKEKRRLKSRSKSRSKSKERSKSYSKSPSGSPALPRKFAEKKKRSPTPASNSTDSTEEEKRAKKKAKKHKKEKKKKAKKSRKARSSESESASE